jgi:hypothetical protein
VVRRLGRSGGASQAVATFPVTSDQQSVAVAVSPDGTRLMATVLTVPAGVGTAPATPVAPPWHVDVEVASAGGHTVTVRSVDIPATEAPTTPRVLRMAGWDATGPVALPDGVSAEQQDDTGGLWQGHPAHLDSRGLPGPPLGGPGCGASFEQPDGSLLCDDVQGMAVVLRRPDGSAIHRFAPTGPGARLSPDGARLAYTREGGGGAVQSWDGSTVALAAGFTPTGWLDAADLIGTNRAGELAALALASPDHPSSLGFAGAFVGVVRG